MLGAEGQAAVTAPWRLGVVTALAAAAFAFALASFETVPVKECQMDGVEDDAYQVSFAQPPSVDMTSHEITVTRGGAPVSRAQVCMRADMGGPGRMSGMGVSDQANEISPGRYEVPVRFMMSGHWRATVIVKERGRNQAVRVSLPLRVE